MHNLSSDDRKLSRSVVHPGSSWALPSEVRVRSSSEEGSVITPFWLLMGEAA
jgi:hypothetical protein